MSFETAVWHAESSAVRASSFSAVAAPSGVRFVDDEARRALLAQAEAARSIVPRPRADRYGSLAHAIDADLESALAIRGALPPPLSDDARLVDSLHDQLRRARLLPARGICLIMPRLIIATDGELVLSDADGRYVSNLLRAAWDAVGILPILILIDEADKHVALPVPKTLDEIVATELARVDTECAGLFASSERLIASIIEEADGEVADIPDLAVAAEPVHLKLTGDVRRVETEPSKAPIPALEDVKALIDAIHTSDDAREPVAEAAVEPPAIVKALASVEAVVVAAPAAPEPVAIAKTLAPPPPPPEASEGHASDPHAERAAKARHAKRPSRARPRSERRRGRAESDAEAEGRAAPSDTCSCPRTAPPRTSSTRRAGRSR